MHKITRYLTFFLFLGVLLLMASCINKEDENPVNNNPVKYTITFNVNSDDITTVEKEYEKNTLLTEEMIKTDVFNGTDPTKEGYEKEDWYWDSSFSTRVSFEHRVTSNESFYLKWIEKKSDPDNQNPKPDSDPSKEEYKVEFMDKTTVIDTKTVKSGDTVDKITAPTKEGYTFDNWYEDSLCSTLFDFSTKITKNTKIYAKYTINVYDITFYDGDVILTTLEAEYDSIIGRPTEYEEKQGYTFINWYEDEDLKIEFNFDTFRVKGNTNVYGKFDPSDSEINFTAFGGYKEGAYVEFKKIKNVPLSSYEAYYKKEDSTEVKIDSQLIRENETAVRVDVIGLVPGTYSIIIKVKNSELIGEKDGLIVTKDDRSGYAHFNYTEGIGAYTNDGTLKSNAVVVYVTDATKNTVQATIGGKTYTGLVKIITACTNENYALDVRILGEIQTTQWNAKSHGKGSSPERQNNLDNLFKYTSDSSGWNENSSSNYSRLYEDQIIAKGINSMSDDEAKGITQLSGLTTFVTRTKKVQDSGYYEYDSYYNMLDVAGGYNITIEGIGPDAAIFQWGFAFKRCNSIEIKNLRFYNYTEDAVGFEGGSNTDTDYGHYWIHNCTFDVGVNNWDVCYEADKGDGDGSTDIKYCHNETISYCQYNKTHKTNLIGSSDTSLQYNVTLHHNYYNECGSRMPLVRQTNIHIYNNYYYKSTSYCSSVRAGAFAFIENNYYDQAKNPFENKSSTIKAYNNEFNSIPSLSSGYTKGNTVSSRTETMTGPDCKPDGSTDYTNFDTNSTLFYYKNNKSDVQDLLEPNAVPEHCKTYSGVLKGSFSGGSSAGGDGGSDNPTIPQPDPNAEKVVISFNSLSTGSKTSNQTVSNAIIYATSDKTVTINETSKTLGGESVTKYVALGGSGTTSTRSIGFTTTKKANITVYFAGGEGRTLALKNSSDTLGTSIETTGAANILNYTYTDIDPQTLYIMSTNSGIDVYLIIIEYLS